MNRGKDRTRTCAPIYRVWYGATSGLAIDPCCRTLLSLLTMIAVEVGHHEPAKFQHGPAVLRQMPLPSLAPAPDFGGG